MLIRTHMEELKEHTNNYLYERHRSNKLVSMGVNQDQSVFKEVKCVISLNMPLLPGADLCSLPFFCFASPAAKMAEERAAHEAKLRKMEAEMNMVFQQKVNEKESKLKQSEEELYARHRDLKASSVL